MLWRGTLAIACTILLVAGCAQTAPQPAGDELAGTSWRLARFRGGDGKVAIPGDRTSYTLAFNRDGTVSARIDCNRGHGSYKTSGSQIEFGPMATTRAMCPPGSMDDQVVRQIPYIRSYLIKEGRLFLSLMADGGTYEFEPLK